MPRYHENTFKSQLIKNYTCIKKINSQILSLYAKGVTTCEITGALKKMYDTYVPFTLISKVTNAVKEEITE